MFFDTILHSTEKVIRQKDRRDFRKYENSFDKDFKTVVIESPF